MLRSSDIDRDLDIIVAKELGWTEISLDETSFDDDFFYVGRPPGRRLGKLVSIPFYSSNVADAWKIVDLIIRDYDFELYYWQDQGEYITSIRRKDDRSCIVEISHKSPAHAICLVFLAFKKIQEEALTAKKIASESES